MTAGKTRGWSEKRDQDTTLRIVQQLGTPHGEQTKINEFT